MSVETTTHVGCLVVNLVCGAISKSYQREVERLISNNGQEFTCNRYKAIFTASLHLRNNDRPNTIKMYQENSIAYHKQTLLPKGVVGVVVSRFLKAQKPSVIRQYAAVLRFYTSFKLDKPTQKQVLKAIDNITGDSKKDRLPMIDKRITSTAAHVLVVETFKRRLSKCKNLPSNRGISEEIYADQLKGVSVYYSPLKVPKDMKSMPYSSMTLSLQSTEYVPPSLDIVTPCFEKREVIRGWQGNDQYIGKVIMLQEQGCKGRVIAIPNAWCQLAFMPLHNALVRNTRALYPKQNCVEDQVKGADAIFDLASRGKPIYSVDMSAATDRIPVELQCDLLTSLGLSKYAEGLRHLVKQDFHCEFAPDQSIRYSVGQPMGLYGSFPLLNLTNLTFCESASNLADDWRRQVVQTKGLRQCNSINPLNWNKAVAPQTKTLFHDGTCYKVIGDDVVFSDKLTADCYKDIVQSLGIQCSPTKSFNGNVAEFAGFVAIPTRGTTTVFRPYKVPNGDTITNPIEFLHAMGVKTKKQTLAPWWDKQLKAYQGTIGARDLSLTPFVTEERSMMSSSFRCDNHYVNALTNRFVSGEYPELNNLSVVKPVPKKYTGHENKPRYETKRSSAFVRSSGPKELKYDTRYSASTRINRLPLFRERRVQDHYGFNPEAYVAAQKTERNAFRTYPTRIEKDPLIKEFHLKVKEKHSMFMLGQVLDTQNAYSEKLDPTTVTAQFKKLTEVSQDLMETAQKQGDHAIFNNRHQAKLEWIKENQPEVQEIEQQVATEHRGMSM